MAKPSDNNNPFFNNIQVDNSKIKPLSPLPRPTLGPVVLGPPVPDLPPKTPDDKNKPDTGVVTPSKETDINQITFNEQTMTVDAFTDLILEDIGGRELSVLSRHWDLAGTSVPKYSPIKNISSVLFANSPINIAPNPNSTVDFFDTFTILLSSYLPSDSELNALDSTYKKSYVYYEPSTNSIIINTANIFNNEGVQVEFITFDSLKDDTIYP